MKKINSNSNLVSLMFLLFLFLFLCSPSQAERKTYVVFMGTHAHESQPSASDINSITNSYYELLGSMIGSKEKARDAIYYSYTHYMKGFAAVLDDDQVHQLSKHPDVISVFENKKHTMHTTRSWEFLGFESNGILSPTSLWNKTNFGEDIIIGVIDSGVWPEHASFSDGGMGPVPSTWNMTANCNTNDNVSCNNKLIGAKYYNKGFVTKYNLPSPLPPSLETARDTQGHGTHCASIAAGRFVPNAHFLESAAGTAKGGSPNARVASYKVIWNNECYDDDVLMAFEDAIKDGVHILSVSLGFNQARHYFQDSVAIGAFLAMSKGIPVICAAGNRGPTVSTVDNFAPWITTVAASTIDRTFSAAAILGNGLRFEGVSFNTINQSSHMVYPLVYSLDAKNPNYLDDYARLCFNGSLDPSKVQGKIVYCDPGVFSDVEKSFAVSRAGGSGMIVSNGYIPDSDPYFILTAVICLEDGPAVLNYIRNTQSPTASIAGGTQIGNIDAPAVAMFSSAGPNLITPEIIKPDITAPGVNILAGYTLRRPPSDYDGDDRISPFKIMSGTSMACPHVAGIAALLKKLHPKWSPAAIRSAIMTTAKDTNRGDLFMRNQKYGSANVFSFGSGHIMPHDADDPGLVYDLNRNDYLNFFCSIGYNSTIISLFDSSFRCPPTIPDVLDFNYPSIFVPRLRNQITVTRKLKNVGTPGTYTVTPYSNPQISITVNPMSLTFNNLNEEKSFKVTITVKKNHTHYSYGGIVWTDGVHVVRSPVAAKQG